MSLPTFFFHVSHMSLAPYEPELQYMTADLSEDEVEEANPEHAVEVPLKATLMVAFALQL